MRYTIRLAQKAEIADLPEIEKAAAQRFRPYLEQLEIPADLLEGLVSHAFLQRAQTDGRLWVAVDTSQVVGFIVAKFLLQSCFVVELDVHPAHGRQGIGSALVEACCQTAGKRGFECITLTTFRYIPWNIPFYQRLGFEVLPAKHWPVEINAIVEHEARYGFATRHRAVMCRWLVPQGDRTLADDC